MKNYCTKINTNRLLCIFQQKLDTYSQKIKECSVLRWEDEVKKEIPIPDCLITKNPSKYTDEDIAAIASYNSKVQALQREREKYKATLQADIIETKGQSRHLKD